MGYGLVMLALAAVQPPIAADATGTMRIAGTRVTLDCLVHAYDRGASAEEVVEQFPTLDLPSVYDTFAYIVRHREGIDEYLAGRGEQATDIREKVEAQFPWRGVRARLLGRHSA